MLSVERYSRLDSSDLTVLSLLQPNIDTYSGICLIIIPHACGKVLVCGDETTLNFIQCHTCSTADYVLSTHAHN